MHKHISIDQYINKAQNRQCTTTEQQCVMHCIATFSIISIKFDDVKVNVEQFQVHSHTTNEYLELIDLKNKFKLF